LAEIAKNMQNGTYDKDETGTDLPLAMWREVLENVQNDVTERIVKRRMSSISGTSTGTIDSTAETTIPPTHSDSASPDLSPAGNRGVRTNTITMREFKQLPWEEQFKLLGETSVEEAVLQGKITIEGT